MKTRDIIIGFVFLVILIAGILWIYKAKSVKKTATPLPTPNITSKVKGTTSTFNVPDGVEKAELEDVSGGNSYGVATRTEVVANLPVPESGKKYSVWLMNSNGKTVSIGNLWESKGGWILEYNSSKYPGYNKVIVTQGIYHILEGSF